MKILRRYLIAGLLVWMPVALTIWIIHLLIHFINSLIPEQISMMLFGRHIPGVGLLVSILLILLTGIIARNFFGQKIIKFWNKIFLHIPIVKSIYKGVKQVSDTLLSSDGNAFRKAILIKFPGSSSYTIAFITGTPQIKILGSEFINYINVYVPTTPNPTSGYFIIVHKDDTKELNMTVDQALRYVISMGAIDPTDLTT